LTSILGKRNCDVHQASVEGYPMITGDERSLYADGSITVTPSRIVIRNQTFSVAHVESVQISEPSDGEKNACRLVAVAWVGVMLMFAGMMVVAMLRTMPGTTGDSYLIGAVFIGICLLLAYPSRWVAKGRSSVLVVRASFFNAMYIRDRDVARLRSIQAAIHEAMRMSQPGVPPS
jgi:Family of unknown function (DUF6232)